MQTMHDLLLSGNVDFLLLQETCDSSNDYYLCKLPDGYKCLDTKRYCNIVYNTRRFTLKEYSVEQFIVHGGQPYSRPIAIAVFEDQETGKLVLVVSAHAPHPSPKYNNDFVMDTIKDRVKEFCSALNVSIGKDINLFIAGGDWNRPFRDNHLHVPMCLYGVNLEGGNGTYVGRDWDKERRVLGHSRWQPYNGPSDAIFYRYFDKGNEKPVEQIDFIQPYAPKMKRQSDHLYVGCKLAFRR